MKKHLSVLMLFVRSSIFKILILLTAMSAVQITLFWMKLKSFDSMMDANMVANGLDSVYLRSAMGIEYIITNSRISWVLGITYILMTIILLRSCAGSGGKQVYTFQRLSISEHGVFAWQAVCNTGFYFLLWAVQALVILVICMLYVNNVHESLTTHQTVFLAFYRSNFIHCLIPLEHVARWVRNVFVIFDMGIFTAYTSYCQRRDQKNVDVIIMVAGVILIYFTEMENVISDIYFIAMGCLWVFRILWDFRKESSYEAR